MGADNFLNNSNFDSEEARYDRQNRLNPPEFAPGQGDNDIFSSSFDTPVGGGGFDTFSSGGGQDIFGGQGMVGSFTGGNDLGLGFNQQSQAQAQQKTEDEQFFDAIAKIFKVISGFFKDLVEGSKGLTPKFVSVYGKNVTITSAVVCVVGLVLRLFGVGFGFDLLIGGILSSAVGILLLMFFVEKGSTCSSQYQDDNQNFNQPLDSQPQENNGFIDFSGSDFSSQNSDFSSSDGFDFGSDSSSYGDDDDDYGYNDDDDDYDDYGSDFNFNEGSIQQYTESVSVEPPDIPSGTYTRQYLYEVLTYKLPNLRANFSDVTNYDEDSKIFLSWDASLREAALVSGCKEEELPDLLELQETLLTIKVTCTRPKSLKPDLLAKELSNLYAYKDGEFNDRVYAVADTVGQRCIITLYTGETALVSLKDMYAKIKGEILNTKNYMPVVLGIDQAGKVIWCDFKKIEYCIVAGMPRSGKSWLVQAILLQMCAFVSPKELNLYIFDPKAGTSDFRSFTLPHVKKFATRYKNEQGTVVNPDGVDMLTTLTEIVRVEAPRRKKLLGDAKCVNIWDFREKCPDVDLPLLYIVIDEAVTLAEDMEKEDKKEYQSYVTQLITQFPNLGIRAFLIPHVVKDQIIKKTATDSVKCRISVKGSPDHIESSTGTKPKDFKYKLCNVGDMAVNIPDIKQQTMFVHGVAITDDNEKNAQIFEYLRVKWSKLEEDEKSSVSISAEDEKFNDELLASIDNEEDLGLLEDSFSAGEVFSNPNEEGLSGLNSDAVDSTDDDFLSDFM